MLPCNRSSIWVTSRSEAAASWSSTVEPSRDVTACRGTIAPGGVDWQLVRPDGVVEIDAHYLLVSDDGEAIEVRSTGLRKASADVAERIARGEAVAASEYYFRTHVRLSTSAPRLAWMNDLIAVSTGERRRDTVRIHVHEVL